MNRFGRWALLLALAGAVGCRERLLDDLDEAQANDLIVALEAGGITADKRGRLGRFSVDVATDDFPAAWRVAREHGLPRPVRRERARWLGFGQSPPAPADDEAAVVERMLEGDPAIVHAQAALGSSGAAISLRVRAAVDPHRIEARVRAVTGLDASRPIELDVHPMPRSRLTALRPGHPVGLWLASGAVAVMLVGSGIAWRRRRASRRRMEW